MDRLPGRAAGCPTTTSRSDEPMATYRDDEGRDIEIDERFFMEWVEKGLSDFRVRLAAEVRMDDIDRRKKEEGNESQEQG